MFDSGRIVLEVQNGLYTGKNKKNHFARLTLPVERGAALGARIDPPGSIVDTSMGVLVTEQSLKWSEGKLKGGMSAAVTHQGEDKPIVLKYKLDGTAIGDLVAGRVVVESAGEQPVNGRFLGKMEEVPTGPGDSLHTITLHELAGPGGYAVLYTSANGGKITHGFGTTPNFNNATHDVDTSGLTFTGDKLGGKLKVTIVPDPWIPKDRKEIVCELTVDAALAQGEWNGTYTGTANGRPVKGSMQGSMLPKPELEKPTKGMIKAENGLVGGTDYHNRVFIHFELDGENVTGGKINNNHTKLAGPVKGGTVKINGEQVEATLNIEAAPGGGVTAGAYTVVAKGVRVGKYTAGTFETHVAGKKVKDGRFWGSVGN